MTVTVTPVNDAPDAVNDTFTVAEDSPATVLNVLANDTMRAGRGRDADGDGGDAAGQRHGDADRRRGALHAARPTSSAPRAFTYTISDGNGGTDTATVTVTVTPVNDPPDAADDSFTVAEDSAATVLDVLANDTIAPDAGETLTVTAVTQPANGTVTLIGGVVTLHAGARLQRHDDVHVHDLGWQRRHGHGDGDGDGDARRTTRRRANDDSFTVAEDSAATVVDVLANDTTHRTRARR